MLADMQHNSPLDHLDQLNIPENNTRSPAKNMNLHDGYHDQQKIAKRKLSTTHVLNAGGTGGGIRKDVKIIKSKNAVKLGVWSGDSSKSQRKQELSEIGTSNFQ